MKKSIYFLCTMCLVFFVNFSCVSCKDSKKLNDTEQQDDDDEDYDGDDDDDSKDSNKKRNNDDDYDVKRSDVKKSNTEKSDEELRTEIKKSESALPVKVDYCTTWKEIYLTSGYVVYRYTVHDSMLDNPDEVTADAMRNVLLQNIKDVKSSRNADALRLFKLLKDTNRGMKYIYTMEKSKRTFTVTIRPGDF